MRISIYVAFPIHREPRGISVVDCAEKQKNGFTNLLFLSYKFLDNLFSYLPYEFGIYFFRVDFQARRFSSH